MPRVLLPHLYCSECRKERPAQIVETELSQALKESQLPSGWTRHGGRLYCDRHAVFTLVLPVDGQEGIDRLDEIASLLCYRFDAPLRPVKGLLERLAAEYGIRYLGPDRPFKLVAGDSYAQPRPDDPDELG
jgi:hypothetical protein